MSLGKPCIAILQGTFNIGGQNTSEFKEYSKQSFENEVENGGKLLGKYVISENLEKGAMPHVIYVIQFPSRERAEVAFTNRKYKAIKPLRNIAFKEVKILLSDNYVS